MQTRPTFNAKFIFQASSDIYIPPTNSWMITKLAYQYLLPPSAALLYQSLQLYPTLLLSPLLQLYPTLLLSLLLLPYPCQRSSIRLIAKLAYIPLSSTIIIIITVIPSTLLMLVCTVVVIILIVRWRIIRKQVDATHEHLEMNTNEAYTANAAEVANVAYVTAGDAVTTGDAIPATQNVAYGQVVPICYILCTCQVPPGTDDYDYILDSLPPIDRKACSCCWCIQLGWSQVLHSHPFETT